MMKDRSNSELFKRLCKLRSKIAEKRGIQPYEVFSDSALHEMCRIKPTNTDMFLTVNGVGETKLKLYGKLFTDEIRRFILSDTKSDSIIEKPPAKKAGTVSRYTIPYDKWTEEETSALIAEYNSGMSIKDIAWGHNRTKRAIRFALDRLREKNLIY
ncbi:MAG: HRDC domain-containing protein [Ruminococcus sp.]|nr:HRDC domain-containing protein [Ruminococcus sp.]